MPGQFNWQPQITKTALDRSLVTAALSTFRLHLPSVLLLVPQLHLDVHPIYFARKIIYSFQRLYTPDHPLPSTGISETSTIYNFMFFQGSVEPIFHPVVSLSIIIRWPLVKLHSNSLIKQESLLWMVLLNPLVLGTPSHIARFLEIAEDLNKLINKWNIINCEKLAIKILCFSYFTDSVLCCNTEN